MLYIRTYVHIYHVGDDLKYNMSYSLAYCNKSRYTGFIYHFHIEFQSEMVQEYVPSTFWDKLEFNV